MEWLNNVLVQQAISWAIPVLIPVLAAGALWLFTQIGKLIVTAVKKSETQLDDKIAAWAVAWAEDKLGSGKGEDKLQEACEKIEEWTKGKVKGEQAEKLARAAYQGLYGELKNLKNG
jgi:pyruvoyl-dependent arginine decarboxylase (PvlArgDC)